MCIVEKVVNFVPIKCKSCVCVPCVIVVSFQNGVEREREKWHDMT